MKYFQHSVSDSLDPKESISYYAAAREENELVFLDEDLTIPFYCTEHADNQLVLDWEYWPTCTKCTGN